MLVGNEYLAVYLRCLASLELHTSADFYSHHPLVEYQHKNEVFSTIKNAFAMCLFDTELTAFEEDGRYAAVFAEANVNARNHTFSSFMCVLAFHFYYFPILSICWSAVNLHVYTHF